MAFRVNFLVISKNNAKTGNSCLKRVKMRMKCNHQVNYVQWIVGHDQNQYRVVIMWHECSLCKSFCSLNVQLDSSRDVIIHRNHFGFPYSQWKAEAREVTLSQIVI